MLVRTVKLGDWEFWIEEGPWGVYVSVPDRGGQMDGVPRVAEQLAWAEESFAHVPLLEQIWSTSWKGPSEALPAVRALIEASGGTWEERDVVIERDEQL
jgi:hypothetical protein